jgi:hypothetical protein
MCLQETKLAVISNYDVSKFFGVGYDYAYLLASQTMGSILVTRRAATWSALSVSVRTFSVSTKMHNVSSSLGWWLTSVYGPAHDTDKLDFLTELHKLRAVHPGPWLQVLSQQKHMLTIQFTLLLCLFIAKEKLGSF